MLRVRLLRFCAVLAISGAVCACGQILGVDDYRTQTPDASQDSTGGITFAAQTCGTCVIEHCETEKAACEAESVCRDFAACHFGCAAESDPHGCLYDCLQELEVTTAAVSDLLGCSFGSCMTSCYDCGALSAGGPECGACIVRDNAVGGACDFATQCVEDPECHGYRTCLVEQCKSLSAPDPECRMTCGGSYPTGARWFYKNVGTRVFTGCPEECGAGRHWDCPQPAVWPGITGETALITVRAGDSTQDAASSTVRVRVCAISDDTCERPEATAETANGAVTFELPQTTDATRFFGRYFEVVDPAGTMLYVPWIPLVRDLTLFVPGVPQNGQMALESAAASRGQTLDFVNNGIVWVTVADCIGGLAGETEVTISSSDDSEPYYGLQGNLDGGGIALLINVPPGQTTIFVHRSGEEVARGSVPVRAGALTVVTFNHPQFF